mmetsp:Transcript_55041/g.112483  ORF Transcript_55041/g.112483 Transcript_55041/m.112483 type:complete len:331 (+) Transcript_55041:87-1079(+)
MKEVFVLGGRIVQGGADEVKHFYSQARALEPSENEGKPLMLVNVARRQGDPKVVDEPGGRIYWLPMQEEERVQKCSSYIASYGGELIAGLKGGGTVCVSCQEGIHRSKEFANQLRVYCLQTATVEANLGSVICGRFPAQRICGCTIPCRVSMKEVRISQIRERLFIGPVQAAYQDKELRERGIRAIVNASGSTYTLRDGIEYLDIELEDTSEADLTPALQQSIPFINNAMANNTSVLVHCQAGKSRSASICAAWLMAAEGIDAEDALHAVEEVHRRADPNHGFRAQLHDLDAHRPEWLRGPLRAGGKEGCEEAKGEEAVEEQQREKLQER